MGATSIRRFRQIQVENGDLKPDKNYINNEKGIEPFEKPGGEETDYLKMTDKQLKGVKNDDYIAYLEGKGVDVPEGATKKVLISLVKDHAKKEESTENTEENSNEEDSEEDNTEDGE